MTQATQYSLHSGGAQEAAPVSARRMERPRVSSSLIEENQAPLSKDPWKRRLATRSGRIFIGATCGVAVGAVMTLAQMVFSVPGFNLNTALASILGIAVLGGLHGLVILNLPAKQRSLPTTNELPPSPSGFAAAAHSASFPAPVEERTLPNPARITPEELARMDSPSRLLH